MGTATTARARREARAHGRRVGVLAVSPAGLGLYPRLGFHAYCRVRRSVWAPDRSAGTYEAAPAAPPAGRARYWATRA